MPIDRALIDQLRQKPITAKRWRSIVRAHEEFVATAKPGIFGKWQVLEASGLPLAVWDGETSTAGKQLNLNLGDLTGLDLMHASTTRTSRSPSASERTSRVRRCEARSSRTRS